jgi:hypothetical protein
MVFKTKSPSSSYHLLFFHDQNLESNKKFWEELIDQTKPSPIRINEAKYSPKIQKLRKQINGRFNSIVSHDENT